MRGAVTGPATRRLYRRAAARVPACRERRAVRQLQNLCAHCRMRKPSWSPASALKRRGGRNLCILNAGPAIVRRRSSTLVRESRSARTVAGACGHLTATHADGALAQGQDPHRRLRARQIAAASSFDRRWTIQAAYLPICTTESETRNNELPDMKIYTKTGRQQGEPRRWSAGERVSEEPTPGWKRTARSTNWLALTALLRDNLRRHGGRTDAVRATT